MSLKIGIGKLRIGAGLLESWPSYWSTRSLFFLDGTIVTVGENKYFKDRSVNARNFLITGYDFDSTWTLGFPYKSAATISAPAADTALIAADINNFLYDSAGNPNQIPVISLFQNVDYENTIYCKHIAQVLDSNGVETTEPSVSQIFMTAAALSAADLIKANTYFGVPAKLTEGIREVGAGKTYSTIAQAITAASAGETIYIYSGIHDVTTSFFTVNKNVILKRLGNVILTSTTGSYEMLLSNAPEFEGLNFISQKTTLFGVAVVMATLRFRNCRLPNVSSIGPLAAGYVTSLLTIDSNVINNTVADHAILDACPSLIKNNYFKNVRISCTTSTFDINNNDFIDSLDSAQAKISIVNASVNVLGNKFSLQNYLLSTDNTSMAAEKIINFLNNTITTLTTANLGYYVIAANGSINGKYQFNIKNNRFTTTQADRDTGKFIYLLNQNFDIEGNIALISNNTHFALLLSDGTRAVTSGRIANNYIETDMAGNAVINLGNEAATINVLDAIEITGNRLIGVYKNAPELYPCFSHGLLAGCGINDEIKYNQIEFTNYNYVIKTGLQQAYTSKGVQYNISKNGVYGFYFRGVGGINCFNNTIINDVVLSGQEYIAGIMCDENSEVVAGNFSENVIIKNNIIIFEAATQFLIYFDQHAADNGCTTDYNIYYSTVAKPFRIGATAYSFAEWKALGYDAHSIMLTSMEEVRALFTDYDNGDFSLKAGSQAIGTGEVQLAAYDDGLDASTTWGSQSAIPVIVTKQQGAAWDIGAYVH